MADERLTNALLREFGRLGVRRVRPKIRSSKGKPIKVLQRALHAELISPRELVLSIPHYWAVYVHDGRRAPVRAKDSTFLIWYRDPNQDPRLRAGVTPERASQLRHLTTAQFKKALRLNAEALAAGRQSPVVITTQVNKSTPGVPFFSNAAGGGMSGFLEEVNRAGQARVRRYFFTQLKRALGFTTSVPAFGLGGVDFGVIRDEAIIPI